ncbi:glycerophosphodiester phosphodiesterase [Pedobacter sp. HMF7647]|uniref:Glycerophosphodiester phosphodiesterase n=2 Tax=Hufsiella arboris TaxID=2695275 RepID=A0A7K1Y9E4_9SPHI|nr:glycerophosphodiester phosphodiesterase [Hufsiella arboris]
MIADNENHIDTFRIVRNDFLKNPVVAHRGAWKNTGETENSIGSLKKAIELGCSGSETDVHLSGDSVIYIHHDPKLQGVAIEQTTSAELSKLKLSNGEQLPTLEAYLQEVMTQNKTKLVLEIKASIVSKERSLALTKKVLNMVHEQKAQAWITYISFDWDVCKLIRQLQPYANVEYLNGDKSVGELSENKMNGLDYHYSVLKKNEAIFKEAGEKNIDVNVWTVNDEADMDWLLKNKADFITTNEPEILLKKLAK